MFIWVVSRNILIVALEKVSSIASKCAALPAFGPLSLATFCSGGRPHCRSVNGALCNRCLHIYFLLNKRGAFLLLRAFHWRKWLFFCFVFLLLLWSHNGRQWLHAHRQTGTWLSALPLLLVAHRLLNYAVYFLLNPPCSEQTFHPLYVKAWTAGFFFGVGGVGCWL